MANPTLVAKT